jgi:ribonuclease E
VSKVKVHEGKLPILEAYHASEQIHKALERKVWLPSGGYIVIDKTEAMTVIDVNTGKHVGKANLEETVTKTNLEAAEEVARQLRLRDIGGMIVVDFIDMLLDRNKEKVIDAVRGAMARDKTRSQVFDISPLGILEITRKRVSAGLLESFSEVCPTCEGRGILITHKL